MSHRLLQALRSDKVLLMDGAMGTELMRRGCRVPAECCESWNLTHPDAVRAVHLSYLEAGAEVLLTNTFQANPIALTKYGLQDRLGDAWRVALDHARSFQDVAPLVLASIGPFDAHTPAQCATLLDQARTADGLLLETWAYQIGSRWLADANAALHRRPLLVSYTYQHTTRRNLMSIAADHASRVHELQASALGANCGGNIDMDDLLTIVAAYRKHTDLPIFVRPNAGTPVNGVYPRSPEYMAEKLWPLLEAGVTMVGGCCGTTPLHIAAFRRVIDEWNTRGVIR